MKTHLVIHHSLTKDSGTVSWQAIRNYHVNEKGWDDIGYHIGVELIGDRYEIGLGRPLLSRAAAAYQQNMNHCGVHVCFVGDYDKEPPPRAMLDVAVPHLRDICHALKIPVDPDHVLGHRAVASYKTCPGAKFDMDAFRVRMRG
jgi:hypothetical protein